MVYNVPCYLLSVLFIFGNITYFKGLLIVLNGISVLTQYGVVEASFQGKIGKYVRKVKLPEVTKEEAEATFMVLFTTPLERLGLEQTQRQTSLCHRENYALNVLSSGEEHHCFRGECYQCHSCVRVYMINRRMKTRTSRNKNGNV